MTHLTDWQRGYQAGARAAYIRSSIAECEQLLRQFPAYMIVFAGGALLLLATGNPWPAAVFVALFTFTWWSRRVITGRVERLRTLKEDQ